VGRIGTDEVVLSLAEAVSQFMQECNVFLRGNVPVADRVLVTAASNAVAEVFRNSRWSGVLPHRGRMSISSFAMLASLSSRVCSEVAPLLEDDGGPRLPEHAYCVGPLWLERWDDVISREGFEIVAGTAGAQSRLHDLLQRLKVIGWRPDIVLPEALRHIARDLVEMVDRPPEVDGQGFTVEHQVESSRAWVALPLAYHRFCGADSVSGQRAVVREPDQWLEALTRATSASATLTATAPVLPEFADRPFLALLTNGNPTGFDRVFDDRYFMASAELNLLNTILFAGETLP
jgi:hypothetical protein